MLNRISVTTLLTSIVALMATCIVALLAVNAWQSLDRLKAAGRISVITGLSRDAFVAMHRLRTDRSTTFRTLNGEALLDPDLEKTSRNCVATNCRLCAGSWRSCRPWSFPNSPRCFPN